MTTDQRRLKTAMIGAYLVAVVLFLIVLPPSTNAMHCVSHATVSGGHMGQNTHVIRMFEEHVRANYSKGVNGYCDSCSNSNNFCLTLTLSGQIWIQGLPPGQGSISHYPPYPYPHHPHRPHHPYPQHHQRESAYVTGLTYRSCDFGLVAETRGQWRSWICEQLTNTGHLHRRNHHGCARESDYYQVGYCGWRQRQRRQRKLVSKKRTRRQHLPNYGRPLGSCPPHKRRPFCSPPVTLIQPPAPFLPGPGPFPPLPPPPPLPPRPPPYPPYPPRPYPSIGPHPPVPYRPVPYYPRPPPPYPPHPFPGPVPGPYPYPYHHHHHRPLCMRGSYCYRNEWNIRFATPHMVSQGSRYPSLLTPGVVITLLRGNIQIDCCSGPRCNHGYPGYPRRQQPSCSNFAPLPFGPHAKAKALKYSQSLPNPNWNAEEQLQQQNNNTGGEYQQTGNGYHDHRPPPTDGDQQTGNGYHDHRPPPTDGNQQTGNGYHDHRPPPPIDGDQRSGNGYNDHRPPPPIDGDQRSGNGYNDHRPPPIDVDQRSGNVPHHHRPPPAPIDGDQQSENGHYNYPPQPSIDGHDHQYSYDQDNHHHRDASNNLHPLDPRNPAMKRAAFEDPPNPFPITNQTISNHGPPSPNFASDPNDVLSPPLPYDEYVKATITNQQQQHDHQKREHYDHQQDGGIRRLYSPNDVLAEEPITERRVEVENPQSEEAEEQEQLNDPNRLKKTENLDPEDKL